MSPDLVSLLENKGNVSNLYAHRISVFWTLAHLLSSKLGDKVYHGIFEALFKCALSEKQSFLTASRKTSVATASSRLSRCADALRLAVGHGATKLRRKTILALIDHITESLPGPDDELVEPLVNGYLRALLGVLAHPANVEQISLSGADGWLAAVDFCVQTIVQTLGSIERDSGPGSRASPAPGATSTISLSLSTKSGVGLGSKATGSHTIQLLVQCLHYLAAAPNAPLLQRAKEIFSTLVQVLQLRNFAVGLMQLYSFSAASSVINAVQTDDVKQAASMTMNILPHIGHWWQPRSVSRDAGLKTIRDEILKTIFAIHLQLQHLCIGESADFVKKEVEDLLDLLWVEYAKRDSRSQLQLDDLSFAYSVHSASSFALPLFALRPHNPYGETHWAVVQAISLLEALLARSGKQERPASAGDEAQPRKRRRVGASLSRIRQKLKSLDPGTQRTALQLIPFLINDRGISAEDLLAVFGDVALLAANKQSITASWAMIACARYATRPKTSPSSADG